MSKELCPFCGLHPFDYADYMAIAVTCCEYGYMLYDKCMDYEDVKRIYDEREGKEPTAAA